MSSIHTLEELKQQLEKKGTFSAAVAGLKELVKQARNQPRCSPDLLQVVTRCHTLLKARYTNPAFWKAGQALFIDCLELPLEPTDRAKCKQFLLDANDLLQENQIESRETAENSSDSVHDVFFAPASGNAPHFDDAGPIVEDVERQRRAERASTSYIATNAADVARQQQRAELQRSILEGIQAVYSGMEAIARGTDHVEQELVNIMNLMQRPGGPSRAPPASAKVVAALPKFAVDEAKLTELGQETQCAVCLAELQLQDEVQVLPCRHVYHVRCVAPWLAANNSCPVCRSELPTDDPNYEAKKEKEKEDAAEKQGAANALSHNEFMFI